MKLDPLNLPAAFELDGARYLRAQVASLREGVIAQYREDASLTSRHAFVAPDGSVTIDHTDFVNPDRGPVQAAAHFVVDHPLGIALGLIGLGMYARKKVKR